MGASEGELVAVDAEKTNQSPHRREKKCFTVFFRNHISVERQSRHVHSQHSTAKETR